VPDHPLLGLCAVTKIPVPPIAPRSPRRRDRPELVDPWIGAENEAWQELVFRAQRHLRLRELGAPDVILAVEAVLVQRAFDSVFEMTSVWKILRPNGIVGDHVGRDPIRLVPSPFASAFSATGSRLAVAYLRSDDSVAIAVLDPKARRVIAQL
jgi:hypothetical protein